MGNCLVRIKQDLKQYRSSRHREQPWSLGRRSRPLERALPRLTRCPNVCWDASVGLSAGNCLQELLGLKSLCEVTWEVPGGHSLGAHLRGNVSTDTFHCEASYQRRYRGTLLATCRLQEPGVWEAAPPRSVVTGITELQCSYWQDLTLPFLAKEKYLQSSSLLP